MSVLNSHQLISGESGDKKQFKAMNQGCFLTYNSDDECMTTKVAATLKGSAGLPWRRSCGSCLIQRSLATASISSSIQHHDSVAGADASAASTLRMPDRPSAKLNRDEKRRVVDLRYLHKSYIPSDVRRLVARTTRNGENSVVDGESSSAR